jgi:2-haloacid dehalogenase
MKYKAYVFDVYGTLFDVYSVSKACSKYFADSGDHISKLWRQKQLEYCFLRQVMGAYIPFHEITKQALQFACESLQVSLTDKIAEDLLNAYHFLSPYPEAEEVLQTLKDETLVVFSNGSPDMLIPLLDNTGLAKYFDYIISVDEVKQYKPSPSAYQHVVNRLNVNREEVLFLSSNTWDIAGAGRFGFQTAWINRTNNVMDFLDVTPDYIFANLLGLTEHLKR